MAATPPTFNPPQQKPGNKIWLWLLLAVAMLCILMIVGLVFFMKNIVGSVSNLMSCSLTGEVAKSAVVAYSMDHDGKFPDAVHWQDDILPYYQRLYDKLMTEKKLKDMPSWFQFKPATPGQALTCDTGTGTTTGFAYNAALSGKLDKDIADRSIIVIYEAEKSAYNASGDPSARPAMPKGTGVGKNRNWLDFPLEGKSQLFKSNNGDLDIDINPSDALEKQPGEESPKDTGTKQ